MARAEIRPGSEFEVDGYWWVPDKTEPRAGHLTFSPATGFRLTVLDWFVGVPPGHELPEGSRPLFPPDQVDVIHGETHGGGSCTLFDAVNRDAEISAHSREIWSSNRLLHGVHVSSPDDLRFDRATVSLRGLKPWLTTPSVVAGVGLVAGLTATEEITELELQLGDGRMVVYIERVEEIRGDERIQVHEAKVDFELDNAVPLTRFKERYLGPLRDLLVLATRESVVVEQFTAYLAPRKPPHGPWVPPGKTMPEYQQPVHVVERVRLDWPVEPRYYDRMLFGLGSFQPDPGAFVRRWFENHARLGEASPFLFGTLDGPGATLYSRLFNLMNFAEAYHRIEHDERPLGDAVHQELFKRMLDSLDSQKQRDVYENPLKYANSLTQRQRVERLVQIAAEVVPGVSSLLEVKLARGLTHTRNWVTHFTTRTDHVLEPPQLVHALRQFVLVLQINLMLDLGLDEETVAIAVRRSYANEVILPDTDGRLGPL